MHSLPAPLENSEILSGWMVDSFECTSYLWLSGLIGHHVSLVVIEIHDEATKLSESNIFDFVPDYGQTAEKYCEIETDERSRVTYGRCRRHQNVKVDESSDYQTCE